MVRNVTKDERFLAIDTECTGLNTRLCLPTYDNADVLFPHPPRPFLVGMCDNEGNTWIFRGRVNLHTREVTWRPSDITKIKQIIKSYPRLVFHNSKFDIRMLRTIGIDLTTRWSDIDDTQGSAHVLDSYESHGLKDQGVKYLGILDHDEAILKQNVTKARDAAKRRGVPRGPSVGTDYHLPYELLGIKDDEIYCVRDCQRTALLRIFHKKELTRQGLLPQYERERRIIAPTFMMEDRGVRLRPRTFSSEKTYRETCRGSVLHDIQQITKLYGNPTFNPRSYKQLGEMLYSRFGLPIFEKTKNGGPSTNEDTLQQLQIMAEDINERQRVVATWGRVGLRPHKLNKSERKDWNHIDKFLTLLLEFRQHNTASTYLQNYEDHKIRIGRSDYIHGNFNPWATNTTRFSSTDPNLQNISGNNDIKLRRVFGPDSSHVWYSIDYSQLELRLMARASGDPTLTRILAEGQDRHQITADALGCSRKQAKNINFAWQYGAGIRKLSLMSGLDAEEFRDAMARAYPGVVAFMDDTIRLVKQRHRHGDCGYVETLYGYKLRVPVSEAYKGTNYIIQGSAGDILKNAMLGIHEYLSCKELYNDIYPIMCIHDEMVFEVKRSADQSTIFDIANIMAAQGDPIGCPTPVEVSRIVTSWDDKKVVTEAIAL